MSNPKIEVLPINKGATPDLQNVNKHTQRGRGLHENSMRKRGAGRSIFSAGKDTAVPVVMGGNQTLEIAATLGMEIINVHTTGNQIVNVVRDDIAPNSPEFYAMGIEDNEVGKLSYNPDLDILAAVMADPAMQALKAEDKMLADIVEGMGMPKETKDAEPQIDRAAELQEKWGCKSGDLWKLGDHRLLIGDCTVRENVDRLMGNDKIDLLFTSPPYNQSNSKGDLSSHRKEAQKLYEEYNDDLSDDEYKELLFSFLETAKEFLSERHAVVVNISYNSNARDLYGKVLFSDRNPYSVKETIVWDKKNALNFPNAGIYSRRCEFVFVMSACEKYLTSQETGNTRWNYWDISKEAQSKEHRAAFPLPLAERAVNEFSLSGCIVYEPFCGTGTTILASHNLGRKCYSLELSEKYGAVILERFATATGITPELVTE